MAFNDQDIANSIKFAAEKLGINNVKDQQASALTNFIKGYDVFCTLPTGFGKSFTFQAFNLCCDYLSTNPDDAGAISIVIFPIKALIDDQIATLKEKGIQALYIDSSADTSEISQGKYSLLFATPETLVSGDCPGRDILLKEGIRERVRGIFIDECHVVPKWGFADKDKKAFRKFYAKLADIRAMIPANVPLMALTATATIQTRKDVIKNLAMFNVHVVEESPNRPNIKLVNIKSSKKDFEHMFGWLTQELEEKQNSAERVIVYCRTLTQCRDLYGLFFSMLKCKKGDKHLPFAMYHSETPPEVQQEVVESFGKEDGHIRVLFSTVAFGMGVDVRGVHTIVHLGVPGDAAAFLQESGRAGRDGRPSISILLTYPGVYKDSRDVDPIMKEYVSNASDCRRKLILIPFGYSEDFISSVPHTCCDVCAKKCTCGGESCDVSDVPLFTTEIKLTSIAVQEEKINTDNLPRRKLPAGMLDNLLERLVQFRLDQLSVSDTSDGDESAANFLAGRDIVSGIPMTSIHNIVAEAHIVFTFQQFQARYAMYCSYHDVWEIMQEVLGSCHNEQPPQGAAADVYDFHSDEDDEFQIICDEDDYGNEAVYNEGEFANAYTTQSSDEDDF